MNKYITILDKTKLDGYEINKKRSINILYYEL